MAKQNSSQTDLKENNLLIETDVKNSELEENLGGENCGRLISKYNIQRSNFLRLCKGNSATKMENKTSQMLRDVSTSSKDFY